MGTQANGLRTACVLAAAVAAVFAAPSAQARITKIEITSRGPAFGGAEFPSVGAYERLVGIATAEVNPNTSNNNVIVDIGLAPKNARGNVEYSFSFYILKPVDLS